MRHVRRIALAAILTFTTQLAAQEPEDGVYVQEGADAPIQHHVETFLLHAAGWYENAPEAFEEFCRKFAIDPDWPSAERMASAYGPFEEEYLARVEEYAASPTGLHPDDWRPAAAGTIIGELYLQLKADGLPWDLQGFLLFIETETGPTFTRYGDRPFDSPEAERRAELFWQGLAATGREAAQLASERREP